MHLKLFSLKHFALNFNKCINIVVCIPIPPLSRLAKHQYTEAYIYLITGKTLYFRAWQ